MKLLLIGTGYVGFKLLKTWKGPTFTAITTTPVKLTPLAPYNPHLLTIKKNTDLSPLMAQVDGVIITAAKKKDSTYKACYLEIAHAVKNSLKTRKKPLYLLYTSSTAAANHPILKETEQVYNSIPNTDTCILRLGGIYGPNRTLLKRAAILSEKGLSGTGNEVTNHIHLEDIVGAIKYFTIKQITGLFNLVNDDHPKRIDLYIALCNLQGLPRPQLIDQQPTRDLSNLAYPNELVKERGYIFKHPHLSTEYPDLEI